MLFNSLIFFKFIFIFMLLYLATKGERRVLVCLAGSYIFYGWWDYRFLPLIFGLTAVNYYCGIRISEAPGKNNKKTYLIVSVVVSLGVLAFFKYYNFFSENLVALLGLSGTVVDYPALNIILPVGISFYTFQAMSYTIDIYRNDVKPERSFLHFSTYIAFFPQLVAGPIVRAADFLPQLRNDRRITETDVVEGLRLIIWGYFLKVVIADSLSVVVDDAFANPVRHNSLSMLIGVIFYSFQIYGDFAGYSLIAIGVAKTLGFDFPRNFNRPYFAKSLSEFWRRWHISLSTWLRDYLYIALGGNRNGAARTYRNLMITMFLGGLWHGASWNFVIWGTLHGLFLVCQNWLSYAVRLIKIPDVIRTSTICNRIYGAILVTVCFSLVSLAWIFFRSKTSADAISILQKIADVDGYSVSGVAQKFQVVKGVLLISLLVFLEKLSFFIDVDIISRQRPYLSLLLSAFVLLLIGAFGTFDNAAFIYFQF